MMMHSRRSIVFVRLLLAVSVLAGFAGSSAAKLVVVATTTQMKAVLDEVGGPYIRTSELIPGGSCPGHYDVRPGDIRKLGGGAVLFIHGYEGFIPRLVAAAPKPGPRVVRVEITDSWLKPASHISAARTVCTHLSRLDPRNAKAYQTRLSAVIARSKKLETELKGAVSRAGCAGKPVAASDQQAPFLRWLGFKVVVEYGRSEDFTAAGLHRITKAARGGRVRLVVDNLQSGEDAGATIAKSLGAARVTLSNFPNGYARTSTWEACVRDNVQRLLAKAKG